MKLKSLYIHENYYGEDIGKYTGTIKFKGNNGDITLNLTSELSNALLAVVSEQVIASVKIVAEKLTIEAIQPLAIEDTSEGEVTE